MTTLASEAGWPRETVDRDYNARESVPPAVFEDVMRRYRALSDAGRSSVGTLSDVLYDAKSGQTFDILGSAEGELRPVFMFVHGGYWRALSKRDSSFMAPMLAARGIATAVIDYRLAPEVSLAEIVREVRAGLAFLWREGASLGLDPNRIFVGGSSAGGHLTGMLLSGGWHGEFGVPTDAIKGALPVSGLFHLAPIAKSFVQEWITLTPAEVEALSPAANLPRQGCPLIVAFAAGEPAANRASTNGSGARRAFPRGCSKSRARTIST
jgi:arylformamidase